MPTKVTMLFNSVTPGGDQVGDKQVIGGWSESFWQEALIGPDALVAAALYNARLPLVCATTALVGVRATQYSIPAMPGNLLRPIQSKVLRFNRFGSLPVITDILQMCLDVNTTTTGKPNKSKFKIGNIPDSFVVVGNFRPNQQYAQAMQTYVRTISQDSWGFVGRVIDNEAALVMGLAANVLTTSFALAGVVPGHFVRINRGKTSDNLPFTGTFRVASVDGNAYTLEGTQGVALQRAGTVRRDQVAFCDIDAVEFGVPSTRKIGRPFFQLRGRASKRRR
jgi:hypothetical protein